MKLQQIISHSNKVFLLFCLLTSSTAFPQTAYNIVDSLRNDILHHISTNEKNVESSLNSLLQCYSDRYSTQSPQYADCLMWCSYVCFQLHDVFQARTLLKQATNTFHHFGNGPFRGLDTLHEIFRLDMLSEIEYETGREYMALRYADKSVSLKEKYFGTQSEQYLQSLLNLSILYADRGNQRLSNHYHNIGYSTYVDLIRRQFCQRSENERTTYWSEAMLYINKTLELAYQAADKNAMRSNQSLAKYAYNVLLLSKSLLLNTTISFENHIKSSGNLEALQLLNHKKKLVLNDTTVRQIDSIDYAILSILNQTGHPFELPNLFISWEDVQAKLFDDDLAIEFYKTRNNEYGAVLLKRGWDAPKLVRLNNIVNVNMGEDSKKKKQIVLDQLLKEMIFADTSSTNFALLWEIGKSIWCDGIIKHFPDEKRGKIYFSTDGELQMIGIEYLPITKPVLDENGNMEYYCISDLYDICRLSSTRELVLRDSSQSKNNAALFGGLRYDYNQYNNEDSIETDSSDVQHIRGGISFLKGTEQEVRNIHEIINNSPNDIHDTLFLGNNGPEESFKALGGERYKLIHIATHGFFFDTKDTNLTKKYRLGSNPLSYCGLYMTGANAKWRGFTIPIGDDDGFLTALEISAIDLRGLDLVVLSACETARGYIATDGVFGLQRSFKMAGARSILMSLWKVDDAATLMLMTRFYENMYSRNMSKRQALKDAQDFVRNYEVDAVEWAIKQRKIRNIEENTSSNDNQHAEWSDWKGTRRMIKPYYSPYYWASFILLDGLD